MASMELNLGLKMSWSGGEGARALDRDSILSPRGRKDLCYNIRPSLSPIAHPVSLILLTRIKVQRKSEKKS